jgi:cytochrome P450
MSVETLETRRTGANGSARPTGGLLAHIPGDDGWPFVGHTLAIVADYRGFVERRVQRYGMVHRGRAFGHANVTMLGPEANELVFLDPQKQFSSALGWGIVLDKLFPRGLMLLDFDEHRVHRRVLSVAFKADPMRSYLAGLNAGIAKGLAQWPRRRGFKFYPAIKQLTLDLAATSFLGGELGPELEAVKRAFIAMVAASISVIRAPLPGTRFSRGVRGRALLADYFNRQIPLRRERGGDDLFSQLCRATWEDGTFLSNADIVGHMNFLMMAAHDTLTSSLTAFVDRLAADPDWQEKLRAEHRGLGLAPSEFEFKGFRIPANVGVNVSPIFTHYMPQLWPDPERYDPMRFTPEATRGRHKFAFVPFGGGAHMCLGLHFAYMQAKCFTWHLLNNFRVAVEPGYRANWRLLPIPYPRDGLPVTLAPV